MNKLLGTITFFLVTYFIYGFYISQFELNFVPRKLKTTNLYFDYRLGMNIHSNLSIGSEPLSVIINESKEAENKFLMLTDLNPVLKLPDDNYFLNIGVLQAAKFGYKDSRVIYFSSTEKNLGLNSGESQLKISDLATENSVNNSNSLLLLAHPFQNGFKWQGDIPIGFDGLEIVNLKSMSQRSWSYSKLSTIWSLLLYPFNPKLALIRLFQEPTEELMLFDQVSQTRRFVAFQGAEASARAIPLTDWLIKFPSYQRTLSIASNHLLLSSELSGHMKSDRENILSALKNGQFYICFDALGSPEGFETFMFEDSLSKKIPLGGEVAKSKSLKLYYKLPTEPKSFYEVVLLKNGKKIDSLNTFEGIFPIESIGTYRLQVRISPRLPLPDAVKWLTWIYTNNFYVK